VRGVLKVAAIVGVGVAGALAFFGLSAGEAIGMWAGAVLGAWLHSGVE
jgi:hypothetical protein